MKTKVKSLYRIENVMSWKIIRANSMVEALDIWRVAGDYTDTSEPSSITCIGTEADRPNIFE